MDEPEVRKSVLTSNVYYTDEEAEFLKAVEKYKKDHDRRFPTFCEILAIARSLGYRRVAEPTALPVFKTGKGT